jgi:hypothetical protein
MLADTVQLLQVSIDVDVHCWLQHEVFSPSLLVLYKVQQGKYSGDRQNS